MKRFLFLTFTTIFFCFCSEKKVGNGTSQANYGTFELRGNDTINFTDANGLKQGIWYSFKTQTSQIKEIADTLIYKDGIVINND